MSVLDLLMTIFFQPLKYYRDALAGSRARCLGKHSQKSNYDRHHRQQLRQQHQQPQPQAESPTATTTAAVSTATTSTTRRQTANNQQTWNNNESDDSVMTVSRGYHGSLSLSYRRMTCRNAEESLPEFVEQAGDLLLRRYASNPSSSGTLWTRSTLLCRVLTLLRVPTFLSMAVAHLGRLAGVCLGKPVCAPHPHKPS